MEMQENLSCITYVYKIFIRFVPEIFSLLNEKNLSIFYSYFLNLFRQDITGWSI